MQALGDGPIDDVTAKQVEPVRPRAADPGWLPLILAAVAAIATFAVTLKGTYVYDDLPILLEDVRVSQPEFWGQFWSLGYRVGGVDKLYRPLTSMTFAVQWWLHGDLPWAFHVVNVALHAVASAGVAALAGRLWGTRAACVAGLLFAVHPAHVEPVAWIVGRSELLCAAATFAGLALALRPPPSSAWRIAGIVGCFVVALLAKEQGLLFPPLLLALYKLRRRGDAPSTIGEPPAGEKARTAWLAALLLWGMVGYLLFRQAQLPMEWDRSKLDWSMQPMIRSVGVDRWLMPLVLLGRYAVLLAAPAHLSIEHGGEVIGSAVRFGEPYVYLGAAVAIGGAVALGMALRRGAWPLAFCLLGLGLTYGMVSNAAALIGTIYGERLVYLPSGFLLAIVAAGLARLPRRWMTPLVVLLAAIGAARSVAYARQWRDTVTFYETSLAAQPRSVRLHELVFAEHAKRGDWEAAQAVARRCVAQVPGAFEGHLLLAQSSLELDDVDGAWRALLAAHARGAGDDGRSIAERIAARSPPASGGPATRP